MAQDLSAFATPKALIHHQGDPRVGSHKRTGGEGSRHDKLIRNKLEKLDICFIMRVFNGNPERHKHEPLHLIFSCLDSDFIAGGFQTTHPLKPAPGVPHMIRRCS